MRTDTVVFMTKCVQPVLPLFVLGCASSQQRRGQAPMESLHLALGLGMPVTAEVQGDILVHQPHGELAPAQAPLGVEPGRTMVHQHFLRHPAFAKNPLQHCPHTLRLRTAGILQGQGVTDVIVQHREWSHRLIPPFGAFEVHLPELVRLRSFKPLHGDRLAVTVAHQFIAQKDAMDGTGRQLDSFFPQQMLDLSRSPIRPLLPQFHRSLFQRCFRSPRATVRPPATLPHPADPLGLVPLQPTVPRGPRDPEFATQLGQTAFLPTCHHDKLHSLFLHVGRSPSHPCPLARAVYYTPARSPAGGSVKDVPERFVKDVMKLDTFRAAKRCPTVRLARGSLTRACEERRPERHQLKPREFRTYSRYLRAAADLSFDSSPESFAR